MIKPFKFEVTVEAIANTENKNFPEEVHASMILHDMMQAAVMATIRLIGKAQGMKTEEEIAKDELCQFLEATVKAYDAIIKSIKFIP